MELITTNELIGRLKVSRLFVEQQKKKGLPYKRIGERVIRYDFDKVMEWIESNQTSREKL